MAFKDSSKENASNVQSVPSSSNEMNAQDTQQATNTASSLPQQPVPQVHDVVTQKADGGQRKVVRQEVEPVSQVRTSNKQFNPDTQAKRPESAKDVREKEKKASKGGKSSKTPIVVGCIVAAVVVIFVAKALFGGKTTDFWSLTDGILQTEMGEFDYTIDVYTSGEPVTADASAVAPENTEVQSGEEVADESKTQSKSNNYTVQNKEWGNGSGVVVTDWQYPKYQVRVHGGVASTNPYTAKLTIGLATEGMNADFTDITVIDGICYINIEQMHYWLVNSGDPYLVSLGKQMPEGSKYLKIDESDLIWYSGYAEDEEKDASRRISVRQIITSLMNGESIVKNTLVNGVGKDAYSETNGVYYVAIQGDNAKRVVNNFRGILNNIVSMNSSISSDLLSKGVITDANAQQNLNENDNILASIYKLQSWLSENDNAKIDLLLDGNAREYTNIYNQQTVESSIRTMFNLEDKYYSVKAKFSRTAVAPQITIPVESTVTRDKLSSPDIVYDTAIHVIDYFNPTSVTLIRSTKIDDNALNSSIIEYLCDKVNSTEGTGWYLTENNYKDYLTKYTDWKDDATDTEGALNAQIVEDFYKVLNEYTGSVTYTTTVIGEVEEVKRHPEVKGYITDDVYMETVYDEDASDSQHIHLRAMLCNTNATEPVDVDLTLFTVQDLLASRFPANNEVLLRSYDNNWDMSTLQKTVSINPQSYVYVDLWFVTNGQANGYLDLWYNEEKIEVIQSN